MTIQFEIVTTIKHPIEEVFDRLSAIEDYSQWLPKTGIFISTSQTSTGPVGLGTTYVDQTTMGTFRGEVIEFERPTKIGFRHRLRWFGMTVMETRPRYILESVEGDTRFRHIAEGRLFGLFKLMQPLAAHIARKERKRTVVALEKSFERSSR